MYGRALYIYTVVVYYFIFFSIICLFTPSFTFLLFFLPPFLPSSFSSFLPSFSSFLPF